MGNERGKNKVNKMVGLMVPLMVSIMVSLTAIHYKTHNIFNDRRN